MLVEEVSQAGLWYTRRYEMKTISQVAQLTGVSVRTLQYYDEIDLLKPADVTDAGYRMSVSYTHLTLPTT